MSGLTALPNVGKVMQRHLAEAGIDSPEQLRALGAEEVFLRIRANDPTACINMLYGLQGAVEGKKDKDLEEDTKSRLKRFYQSLSQSV